MLHLWNYALGGGLLFLGLSHKKCFWGGGLIQRCCSGWFLGGLLWSNAPFVFVRWIRGMKAEGSPLGE